MGISGLDSAIWVMFWAQWEVHYVCWMLLCTCMPVWDWHAWFFCNGLGLFLLFTLLLLCALNVPVWFCCMYLPC
jgi:hypothetical protein